LCGKCVEARGVDLFDEVVRRNLEGMVAKRKSGIYTTVSGWLKVKNPLYTQSERRYELFDSFKAKQTKKQLPPLPKKQLPPIPKKQPRRAVPLQASQKRRKTEKRNVN
jgi:hypothetical protein